MSVSLLFAMVTLGSPAAPAVRISDPIDTLVEQTMRNEKVPGMTLAILRDGKPVKQRGYGFASVELRVPAKLETVYELASVSKQFTAVATLMLVDEGKLSLDDSASQFVPDAPPSWSAIKIRHLLTHTSGLPEFHMRPDRLSALSFMRYTDAMQVEDLRRSTLQFAPGSKFGYSNAGMELLALIVAKVSGMPFPKFVQERILNPMGMSQTRFKSGSDVIPNRAEGYTLRDGVLKRWTLSQTLQSLDTDGFGGLLSTVGDLAKWEGALANGKFLQPSTWKTAWTPPMLANGQRSNYGMGWNVTASKYGPMMSHSGHTGTLMIRLPEKKLTVIILSNLGIGNPPPYGKDAGWGLYGFADKLLAIAVPRYGSRP